MIFYSLFIFYYIGIVDPFWDVFVLFLSKWYVVFILHLITYICSCIHLITYICPFIHLITYISSFIVFHANPTTSSIYGFISFIVSLYGGNTVVCYGSFNNYLIYVIVVRLIFILTGDAIRHSLFILQPPCYICIGSTYLYEKYNKQVIS